MTYITRHEGYSNMKLNNNVCKKKYYCGTDSDLRAEVFYTVKSILKEKTYRCKA